MEEIDEPFKALQAALLEGNFDKVATILKENDLPVGGPLREEHQREFNEPTALTLAVDYGHIDLVRSLLQFGGEYYTVGEKLLEYKGVPDDFIPLDYFGAMVHAAIIDRFDIIQLLAEFRIFMDTRADNSFREIVLASKEQTFEKLGAFLNALDDKITRLKGWKGHNLMNLLILRQCSTSCIQLMLDHGIDVNGWDLNGLTPLRCAVLSKAVESVQFLIDKGADVYAVQLQGDTHFKDDGSFIDDRSARLSPSDADWWKTRLSLKGPSTLMYAASVRNVPVLKLLLDSSPRHLGFHEICDHLGNSPLNYAIRYGDRESIDLMLKYKAVQESIGRAATVDLTVGLGNMELFELMLGSVRKWDPFSVFLCSLVCARNKPQYLQRLLKCFGKTFRKWDKGGCLHSAIEAGSLECAQILFKQPRFNVNTRYKYFVIGMHSGLTALMYSCVAGKDDLVRLFLKMGAKVDTKDKVGMTAVMHATKNDYVECLLLLMEAQADLDKIAKDGSTVLSFAMSGDGNCLEILLKSRQPIDWKTLKLKDVHSKALIKKSRSFYVRNIALLMKHNVFEWDWCSLMPSLLPAIAFAAVTHGLSPRNFEVISDEKAFTTSLLLFAYSQKKAAIIRYLQANLFFLPEDYRLLSMKLTKNLPPFDNLQQLDCHLVSQWYQPLSLYQWSFLTISKIGASVESHLNLNERSRWVDCLPLPTKLKDELKFKRKYSHLCPNHWSNLGCQSCDNRTQIDELVVGGEVFKDLAMKDCTADKCACGNLGLSFETGK